MYILIILMLALINPIESFRFKNYSYTPLFKLYSGSYNESLYRNPFLGEQIKLPKVNDLTGQYLLDRPLIEKIASLRTFIECIEFNRGKKPTHNIVEEEQKDSYSNESQTDNETEYVEINEENLDPIKHLLIEEDLLEEVLSNAFETYKKKNDLESIDRLSDIAEQIVPIATKLRKLSSESNISRIISSYLDNKEHIDDVLDDLLKKKALNKYLLKRLDELINLAAKKYRISDKHPAVSEEFLKVIKDRISAQRITDVRGTNLFVKILALCFEVETDDQWDQILRERLRTIEDLEQFHEWLEDGIDYCKNNNKIGDKIDIMERIMQLVVRQHPIWNPKDDNIEYEDPPNKKYDRKKELENIEKMIEGK